MSPKCLLLISFTVALFSVGMAQKSDSVRIADVAGYYAFYGKSDPYPKLTQITLGTEDSISFSVKAPGYVVFYSDTTIAPPDTDAWCPISDIRITKDSLFFSTQECLNEQYRFAGHWLLPIGTFDREGYPAVLEGALDRYVHGKFRESKKVCFEYSPEC